jgi:hypothetical protein
MTLVPHGFGRLSARSNFVGERKMENIRLLLALCIMSFLLASHALASEGVTRTRDRCYIRIGPYLMSYNAYQAEARSNGSFCVDLPAMGRTLIILDVEQQSGGMGLPSDYYNELRDMAVDFRIIRDVEQSADEAPVEPETEAYLPPRKYPTGTLRLEHTFTKLGNYIGLVTARDDHGRVFEARFPFVVGPRFNPVPYAIGGAVVVAAGAGLFLAYRASGTKRMGRFPRFRTGRPH